MKNYYSTVDNVVMTFSDIEEKNGFDQITIHFERPNANGDFGFAEGNLPENRFYKKREAMSYMPKTLLDFMGYKFYFWAKEDGEPIHVHVSKGKQTENATKFWIKRDGIFWLV